MLLVLVFLLQTTAGSSKDQPRHCPKNWLNGLPGCFSDMGLWQRWHPRCEGHCMLLHAIAMKPTWMTWVNLEATGVMEIPETWALSLHQCQLSDIASDRSISNHDLALPESMMTETEKDKHVRCVLHWIHLLYAWYTRCGWSWQHSVWDQVLDRCTRRLEPTTLKDLQ